jgi:single-strand selective monofunctional uracil DNA glycosylase
VTRAPALAEISRQLSRDVAGLVFAPPVAFTYNPLDYAWPAHARYLQRWGSGTRKVLLLGMNPGPFGMAQTGVPFGDVTMVREFLDVSAKVGRPPSEHPKRLVTGFDCRRPEVSGTRLWGWAKNRFETPERFFSTFFVANYCPLVFMASTGRNMTPDKLPRRERERLYEACDRALLATVDRLEPQWVIGVGAFAAERAVAVVGTRVKTGSVLHPSPASPRANRGWSREVEKDFAALGLKLP